MSLIGQHKPNNLLKLTTVLTCNAPYLWGEGQSSWQCRVSAFFKLGVFQPSRGLLSPQRVAPMAPAPFSFHRRSAPRSAVATPRSVRWIFFAGNWPGSRQLAEEQLLLGNGSPVTHHRLVFWLILGRHPASLYQPNPYPNTNTSYPTAASRSAHKFPQAPAIVEVSKILSASAVSLWDELTRFCATGHILIFTRIAESNQQNLLCQATLIQA